MRKVLKGRKFVVFLLIQTFILSQNLYSLGLSPSIRGVFSGENFLSLPDLRDKKNLSEADGDLSKFQQIWNMTVDAKADFDKEMVEASQHWLFRWYNSLRMEVLTAAGFINPSHYIKQFLIEKIQEKIIAIQADLLKNKKTQEEVEDLQQEIETLQDVQSLISFMAIIMNPIAEGQYYLYSGAAYLAMKLIDKMFVTIPQGLKPYLYFIAAIYKDYPQWKQVHCFSKFYKQRERLAKEFKNIQKEYDELNKQSAGQAEEYIRLQEEISFINKGAPKLYDTKEGHEAYLKQFEEVKDFMERLEKLEQRIRDYNRKYSAFKEKFGINIPMEEETETYPQLPMGEVHKGFWASTWDGIKGWFVSEKQEEAEEIEKVEKVLEDKAVVEVETYSEKSWMRSMWDSLAKVGSKVDGMLMFGFPAVSVEKVDLFSEQGLTFLGKAVEKEQFGNELLLAIFDNSVESKQFIESVNSLSLYDYINTLEVYSGKNALSVFKPINSKKGFGWELFILIRKIQEEFQSLPAQRRAQVFDKYVDLVSKYFQKQNRFLGSDDEIRDRHKVYCILTLMFYHLSPYSLNDYPIESDLNYILSNVNFERIPWKGIMINARDNLSLQISEQAEKEDSKGVINRQVIESVAHEFGHRILRNYVRICPIIIQEAFADIGAYYLKDKLGLPNNIIGFDPSYTIKLHRVKRSFAKDDLYYDYLQKILDETSFLSNEWHDSARFYLTKLRSFLFDGYFDVRWVIGEDELTLEEIKVFERLINKGVLERSDFDNWQIRFKNRNYNIEKEFKGLPKIAKILSEGLAMQNKRPKENINEKIYESAIKFIKEQAEKDIVAFNKMNAKDLVEYILKDMGFEMEKDIAFSMSLCADWRKANKVKAQEKAELSKDSKLAKVTGITEIKDEYKDLGQKAKLELILELIKGRA
ncbi:hypothetical protein KKC59_03240, partial [bacterium]|nr:hypothetical protein [bacterium]